MLGIEETDFQERAAMMCVVGVSVSGFFVCAALTLGLSIYYFHSIRVIKRMQNIEKTMQTTMGKLASRHVPDELLRRTLERLAPESRITQKSEAIDEMHRRISRDSIAEPANSEKDASTTSKPKSRLAMNAKPEGEASNPYLDLFPADRLPEGILDEPGLPQKSNLPPKPDSLDNNMAWALPDDEHFFDDKRQADPYDPQYQTLNEIKSEKLFAEEKRKEPDDPQYQTLAGIKDDIFNPNPDN